MGAMLTQLYNTPYDSVPIDMSEGLVVGSLLLNMNKMLSSYISFVSYSALNAYALSLAFESSNACQYSVRDRMT